MHLYACIIQSYLLSYTTRFTLRAFFWQLYIVALGYFGFCPDDYDRPLRRSDWFERRVIVAHLVENCACTTAAFNTRYLGIKCPYQNLPTSRPSLRRYGDLNPWTEIASLSIVSPGGLQTKKKKKLQPHSERGSYPAR